MCDVALPMLWCHAKSKYGVPQRELDMLKIEQDKSIIHSHPYNFGKTGLIARLNYERLKLGGGGGVV